MSNWDKERMKEHLQKKPRCFDEHPTIVDKHDALFKENNALKQSKKSKLHATRLKRQVLQIVREAYSAKNDALPPMIYIRSKLDVLIHEDRLWP